MYYLLKLIRDYGLQNYFNLFITKGVGFRVLSKWSNLWVTKIFNNMLESNFDIMNHYCTTNFRPVILQLNFKENCFNCFDSRLWLIPKSSSSCTSQLFLNIWVRGLLQVDPPQKWHTNNTIIFSPSIKMKKYVTRYIFLI